MNDHTTARGVVELSVPLTAEFASAIRVLVSSIAADVDFTVDELDDLRLAVSEVFTILTEEESTEQEKAEQEKAEDAKAEDAKADPAARCVTSIDVVDGEVVISMIRGFDAPIEVDELAATILGSVVDSHDTIERGIVFRKRAVEARG